MTEALEIRLLGDIEVGVGDAAVPVRGQKLQALVALLALGAPHPVSADQLIDELWGDEQPGNPENALQAQISQARRVVGRDRLTRQGGGYALAVEPDAVDVLRLERLVREGRAAAGDGHVDAAAVHYEAALAMVRGPALGALVDYRFARGAMARVEDLLLAAHEGLADALLATGRHAEAATALLPLVRDHPLRERFHAQLVLAFYRCGRQADALAAYQAARTILLEELGLEPGAELQALERGVLTHDPSLTGGVSRVPDLPQPAVLPGSRDLEDWRSTEGDGSAPQQMPLVGREAELGTLEPLVDESLNGRARLILLEGEPGIGKTRMARELANRATASGAAVVWGRSYEGRNAPAFWMWTQVVDGLLTLLGDEVAREALGADAPELAQIVPAVKDVVPGLEAVLPLDPESARFRMCQAVTGFVRRAARRQPVLVVLDDLHWSDDSSMEAIAVLATDMADERLLAVATYRSVDPTIGETLSLTLAEVSRQPGVERLVLPGLDRAGLTDFLAAAGTEVSEELVTTVEERTRGNPFFVAEILRLVPAGAGAADAREVGRTVPSTVKGVIERRVLRLPDETQRSLMTAAILGHDFDLSLLAAMLDLDAGRVLEQSEPALMAGILVESPVAVGRLRFSHGLVHETVYADMGAAQRARLHLRAAEAIEDRYGTGDGPHLTFLASHWRRAVPVAPADRAVTRAIVAARWLQNHVAHGQAEEQLRGALDLLESVPSGAERDGLELEIQDELSMLYVVTTSYSGPPLEVACNRIAELSDRVEDQSYLAPAMWRLAIHHMLVGQIQAGLAVGRRLIERSSDPTTVLAGHMCLAAMLLQDGRLVEAMGHADEAIRLCDDGHDAPLVGGVAEHPGIFTRSFACQLRCLLGDHELADEHLRRSEEIADGLDPHAYGRFLWRWGAINVVAFRLDAGETLRFTSEAMAIAAAEGFAMGGPYGYAGAPRGWALAASGELTEGREILEQSIAVIEMIGATYAQPWFHSLLADVHLMEGSAAEALAAADAGLIAVATTGETYAEAELHRLRGRALAALGDPTAIESLNRAVEVATDQQALTFLRRAEQDLATLS